MIDPRCEAIVIRPKEPGSAHVEKTASVLSYRSDANTTYVKYRGGREYPYARWRVAIVKTLERVDLSGCRVEVRGTLWHSVPEAYRFQVDGAVWWRFFFRPGGSEEAYGTYSASDVSVIEDAAKRQRGSSILAYWRSLVAQLSAEDDPLRKLYANLGFVHPDCALSRYLSAEPITTSEWNAPLIFPFSCNLSQREAVEKALRHPISVIDGPPGTGKTQTILNLIANIIVSSESTVGVVSFNNAAVDNVGEKLTNERFGYVVANLGRLEKQREFFGKQSARNIDVQALVAGPAVARPPSEQIAELDRSLRTQQVTQRELAWHHEELDAYRLELQHFTRYVERQDLPELEKLPLLRRSADRILDYLAETELGDAGGRPIRGLFRRVRGYFRYGPTGAIDPSDTEVILRLQRAYYERKISELEKQIREHEAALQRTNFHARAGEHRDLSIQTLRAGLRHRYAQLSRVEYTQESFRGQFRTFVHDYPVILSTCHSLRRSLAGTFLLDYLIIDVASQVDLLTAALALACARNVVVVGDLRQIQHIPDESACARVEPAPMRAYDYAQHNILSSLIELYGETLPRTMLREHYRCDPAIIGFCNKKFYDGNLIPFTHPNPTERPLTVVRTVKGNHMRQHRGGGRTNQREIDVIVDEVVPQECKGIPWAQIGVTTPYRRQADKVADALIESIQAETVHKFQGREKQAIVMTTVLDETWRGTVGMQFVDDPHLVNVAVSRAAKKFVLVTNYDLLSKSRHLRDLIGYIQYHNPDQEVVDSRIVSVFDLLYRDYSERLKPLAARLKGELRYRSEDIIWTVLHGMFTEPAYSDLYAVSQVLLHSLITDPSGLTPEQLRYVGNRASVDFVVYNRVTNALVQVIEVDGFAYHENDPRQLARDALKDMICETCRIPLLRLPTTGSREVARIRQALDRRLNEAGRPS
ncbi:AAA domain-containing protein [Flindersiella endophytica]